MPANTKLTPEVIEAICARKRENPALTQDELAVEFSLNRTSIKKALVMLNVATRPQSDTGLAMLKLSAIKPSPLNPRKSFDETELDELAESIAENGLLQNLVVRPDEDGLFILVAGERRWRAITRLAATNRWEGPIPCLVIEADDGAHLAMALLENLHRQDVAPLEEADAFAKLQALDPETWTAQAIATRIGRTPRYVYQRLAMATNLCRDAKILLGAGKLNVEGARLLGGMPLEFQEDFIGRYWSEFTDDDDQLPIIDEDDVSILVQDVREAINWTKQNEQRQAEQAARDAERAARAERGEPEPETAEDGIDDEPETEEEKAQREEREARQREYEAQAEKRRHERELEYAQERLRYHALCRPAVGDWPNDHIRGAGEKACLDGCKWRVLLNWSAPKEFHVCTGGHSPRKGLLTSETQGGQSCFEQM